VVNQSKEDISVCKGLSEVAMVTIFWPNGKNITKMT